MRTSFIGRLFGFSRCIAFAGTAIVFSILSAVPASGATIIITVDEHGNAIGTSPGALGADAGPCLSDTTHQGVCNNALVYPLAFVPVEGDLHIRDTSNGPTLDLVRFNCSDASCTGRNKANQLVFYSDGFGGADASDALADVNSSDGPGAFYTNKIEPLIEAGSEGSNSVNYTPTEGQPGFNSSNAITYVFVSDGVVPEPSTLALTGSGLLGLVAFSRRRRVVSSQRP